MRVNLLSMLLHVALIEKPYKHQMEPEHQFIPDKKKKPYKYYNLK